MQVEGRGAQALAQVAGAQRGVIHVDQLRDLGIGRGSVDHRLSVGSLRRVLPRVLSIIDPVIEPLAAETATLLYAGDDCVLSHESAAALWGIGPTSSTVTVTAIGRRVRRQPGVRIHHVAWLDIRDAAIVAGFPVTAPARTLVDLAARLATPDLERALNEARVLKLVMDAELLAALARCPLRTGTRRLRALLRAERGPALTRSEAERSLRLLLDQAQLPRPRYNARIHGCTVDAVWAAERLVVEVDGFDFHGHRAAFETDRRRDQTLAAAGYTVIRVTWRQLTTEPTAVVARLAQALAAAGPRSGQPPTAAGSRSGQPPTAAGRQPGQPPTDG